MPLLEDVKKSAERVTGWRRPAADDLHDLVRPTKPGIFHFQDDGLIPNNPHWPLLIYWRAARLPRGLDPAAIFEEIFATNGWGDSWRDGIYDYLHYHSRTHEVLGVARGNAKVRFGGNHGRTFRLGAGDVVLLPAGTGHQCLAASKNFTVVGAYPAAATYDECQPTPQDHRGAATRIRKVPRPSKDPVFGGDGPLLQLWPTKR